MMWPPYNKSEQPAALQIASMGISTMIELAAVRSQRDELLAAITAYFSATQSEGRPTGGWIPKPGSTAWGRRVHGATKALHDVMANISKTKIDEAMPTVQHLPADDTEGGGL
jgi:hypothetical protein